MFCTRDKCSMAYHERGSQSFVEQHPLEHLKRFTQRHSSHVFFCYKILLVFECCLPKVTKCGISGGRNVLLFEDFWPTTLFKCHTFDFYFVVEFYK